MVYFLIVSLLSKISENEVAQMCESWVTTIKLESETDLFLNGMHQRSLAGFECFIYSFTSIAQLIFRVVGEWA
jgi:hypothetical protein